MSGPIISNIDYFISELKLKSERKSVTGVYSTIYMSVSTIYKYKFFTGFYTKNFDISVNPDMYTENSGEEDDGVETYDVVK